MTQIISWAEKLEGALPFSPNKEQSEAFQKLDLFMQDPQASIFLLKGYAGTGKTSMLSSIVNNINAIKMKCMMMAPTGRAAKVLSAYSNKSAFTIHKIIYRIQTNAAGISKVVLNPNKNNNTLFIVDEASMIPENTFESGNIFGDRSLLGDLIQFVKQGKNCKLMLVGDVAQLPPVGIPISPALDVDVLRYDYMEEVYVSELRNVMRQALESGILWNATQIREKIESEYAEPPFFHTQDFKDISPSAGGWELEEELSSSLHNTSIDPGIIICRSNKRANIYNREIRNRILMREEEIESGDQLMIIRNNYYWLPEKEGAGFIANGDLAEIVRVRKIESYYGFRFADVTILLSDSTYEQELDVKIMLDTLMLDGPALGSAEHNKLWEEIMKEYEHLSTRRKQVEAVKNNPYYNALQVKYAYAMTCHKTQGGQWPHVFIDQGYITDEMLDTEYLRWLYTALTRAQEKVTLIGFRPDFFGDEVEE